MNVETYRLYDKLFSGVGGIKHKKGCEAELSSQVAVALRDLCLKGEEIVWFHVPNESNGGSKYGRFLNSIGRIAGAPDYVLITPKKTYLVELKSKLGSLSTSQKIFAKWCSKCSVTYKVIKNMGGFNELIDKILYTKR